MVETIVCIYAFVCAAVIGGYCIRKHEAEEAAEKQNRQQREKREAFKARF